MAKSPAADGERSEPSGRGARGRHAGPIARAPLAFLAGVGVVTVLLSPQLFTLSLETDLEAFLPDTPEMRAQHRAEGYFGTGGSRLLLLAEAKRGDVFSPAGVREAARAAGAVGALPGVERVLGIAPLLDTAAGWDFGRGVYDPNRSLQNMSDTEVESLLVLFTGALRGDYDLSRIVPPSIPPGEIEEARLMALAMLPAGALSSSRIRGNATVMVVEVAHNASPTDVRKVHARVRDTAGSMGGDELGFTTASAELMAARVDREGAGSQMLLFLPMLAAVGALLAAAFRRAAPAALSIVTLLMALMWTVSILHLAGIPFTALEVALLPLVLGLGVDYSVYVVWRLKEEAASGAGQAAAMTGAMRKLRTAFLLAIATTIAAFLTMALSGIYPLLVFGVAAALGIGLSFLLTNIFFCPALLLVGTFGGKGGVLEIPAFDRGMARAATAVSGYPVLVGGVILMVTAGAVVGGLGVQREFGSGDFLPPDWEEKIAADRAAGLFPVASSAPAIVFIEGDIASPAGFERLIGLETAIADDGGTARVSNGSGQQNLILSPLTFVRAALSADPSLPEKYRMDPSGRPLLNATRDDTEALLLRLYDGSPSLKRLLHRGPGGFDAAAIEVFTGAGNQEGMIAFAGELARDATAVKGASVAGGPVAAASALRALQEAQTWTTAASLAASYLVLLAVYRRPVLAAIVTLPVLLSAAWLIGAMALLGIPLNLLTQTVSSLTIGLGIDYSIHMHERYREERRRRPVRQAVEATIERTGSPIFVSAATTAAGFAILLLSPFPAMKTFGLLATLTILFSFVLAVLLLPLLLALWELGRWRG